MCTSKIIFDGCLPTPTSTSQAASVEEGGGKGKFNCYRCVRVRPIFHNVSLKEYHETLVKNLKVVSIQ